MTGMSKYSSRCMQFRLTLVHALLMLQMPSVAAEGWGSLQVKKTVLDTNTKPEIKATVAGESLVSIAISATRFGCHVARVSGDALNGFKVFYDGQAGPAYAEIAKETPVFSEDGSAMAYAARKGTEWLWVVNGVEGPASPELTPTSFAFSVNGKHHGYVVVPHFRQTALIVDGKVRAEGKWDGIMPWDAAPVFSADGKRLAFVEADRSKHLMRVNLDGENGQWHPGIAMYQSPAFGAFITNAIPGPTVQERARPTAFDLRFSPDGRRFAYGTFTDEGRAVMVVDGKKGEPHEVLGFDSLFSPDGGLHAYMARDHGQYRIFSSSSPPLPVDAMYDWSLTSSPDGRHLAFAGIREGKKAIWLDGKAVPMDVTMNDYGNTQPIVFSPDSRRLAFCVKNDDGIYWVVDGKAGPGSKIGAGMALSFSADSRHYAYMSVQDTHGAANIVVDGVVRATYTPVTSGPVFRSDGVLEFIAVDDDGLCRFEVIGL